MSIFIIMTLNSLLDRLLISTSFNSFSEVLSYSFIWNILFCLLILPNSLCVFLCIPMSPNLGDVALCRRCPMRPITCSPLATRSRSSRGIALCRLHAPFCCGRLTAMGTLIGGSGPRPGWLCGQVVHDCSGPLVGRTNPQS